MARSVVNHQEFTDRLKNLCYNRPEHIRRYVETVVRKYFLKNWEKSFKLEQAKGAPKLSGFKDRDQKDYETLSIAFQTSEGVVVKHVRPGSEMYEMIKRGETVFLDLEYMADIQQEILPILDWMHATYNQPRDLTSIAYQDAVKKSKEWHEDRLKRQEEEKKQRRERLAVSSLAGTQILFKINFTLNGKPEEWLLCNLVSQDALVYEGDRLHHCVGDGDFYYTQVKEKISCIWALRKSLLEPMLTMTISINRADALIRYDTLKHENGYVSTMHGLQNRRVTLTEALVLRDLFLALNLNLSSYREFFYAELVLDAAKQNSDKVESVKYEKVGAIPDFIKLHNLSTLLDKE